MTFVFVLFSVAAYAAPTPLADLSVEETQDLLQARGESLVQIRSVFLSYTLLSPTVCTLHPLIYPFMWHEAGLHDVFGHPVSRERKKQRNSESLEEETERQRKRGKEKNREVGR